MAYWMKRASASDPKCRTIFRSLFRCNPVSGGRNPVLRLRKFDMFGPLLAEAEFR